MIEKSDRIVRELTPAEMAQLRRTSIGGSDAPAIMREETAFDTPIWVWGRKLGKLPPKEVTYRMIRGRRLEPIARAKYEEEFGIPMPARVVWHPEINYMHGMLDGRNSDARGALEIKAPGAEDHIEALGGNIPRKYIWQCVHYLAVDPTLEWIDYFSFNPDFDGPETARVRLVRNRRFERELLISEKEFYRFMQTDTAPPPGPKEIPWPWPKYANYKGEKTMGNETQPQLSAREVQVLRWFVLALEGATNLPKSAQPTEEAAPPEPRPVCEVHGETMNRSKFPNGPKYYCYKCSQANKA